MEWKLFVASTCQISLFALPEVDLTGNRLRVSQKKHDLYTGVVKYLLHTPGPSAAQ